jgi:hypothetical protein
VVVVALAAFGIDRMVVALTRYYASHPRSPARAVISNSPSTTVTTGPPPCVSASLTGGVANWQATGATGYETVALTNISAVPCTLQGYPVLAVNSQSGTALPAATRDVGTLGSGSGGLPASPSQVIVAAGAQAWFELAYSDVCSQVLAPGAGLSSDPGACYEGTWLQVTPPHTVSPLLVSEPVRFTYQSDGFDVGPFEAGAPPPSPPIGP